MNPAGAAQRSKMAAVEGEPGLKTNPGCGVFHPAIPEAEFLGRRKHMHVTVAGAVWWGASEGGGRGASVLPIGAQHLF